jgi:hypothetical protein
MLRTCSLGGDGQRSEFAAAIVVVVVIVIAVCSE